MGDHRQRDEHGEVGQQEQGNAFHDTLHSNKGKQFGGYWPGFQVQVFNAF